MQGWILSFWSGQKKDLDLPILKIPHVAYTGNKWELLPLTDSFSSWEEYRKIFIPLMLHELWAMVSREAEEKEEALRLEGGEGEAHPVRM